MSVAWNLKKNEIKFLINIVDLYRRKFCDGHNILVFSCHSLMKFKWKQTGRQAREIKRKWRRENAKGTQRDLICFLRFSIPR